MPIPNEEGNALLQAFTLLNSTINTTLHDINVYLNQISINVEHLQQIVNSSLTVDELAVATQENLEFTFMKALIPKKLEEIINPILDKWIGNKTDERTIRNGAAKSTATESRLNITQEICDLLGPLIHEQSLCVEMVNNLHTKLTKNEITQDEFNKGIDKHLKSLNESEANINQFRANIIKFKVKTDEAKAKNKDLTKISLTTGQEVQNMLGKQHDITKFMYKSAVVNYMRSKLQGAGKTLDYNSRHWSDSQNKMLEKAFPNRFIRDRFFEQRKQKLEMARTTALAHASSGETTVALVANPKTGKVEVCEATASRLEKMKTEGIYVLGISHVIYPKSASKRKEIIEKEFDELSSPKYMHGLTGMTPDNKIDIDLGEGPDDDLDLDEGLDDDLEIDLDDDLEIDPDDDLEIDPDDEIEIGPDDEIEIGPDDEIEIGLDDEKVKATQNELKDALAAGRREEQKQEAKQEQTKPNNPRIKQ